jgi:hypothetical protein
MRPYPDYRDAERLGGITWQRLTEIEPALMELLWRARQQAQACRAWSDVTPAFSPIREALLELVGFAGRNHRHPILGGSAAYQVAYWKLYDAVAGLLPGPAGEQAPPTKRTETMAEPRPAWSDPVPIART